MYSRYSCPILLLVRLRKAEFLTPKIKFLLVQRNLKYDSQRCYLQQVRRDFPENSVCDHSCSHIRNGGAYSCKVSLFIDMRETVHAR